MALLAPAAASAHEIGVGTPTGFVATVASVRPNVVGLQARVVLGDQLQVTNLSRREVEILDRAGRPFIRIPTGSSRAWHDPRVVGRGEPPAGAVATRDFTIDGFLGWVPPEESGGGGISAFLLAAGALALVALSVGAAYLLGRGRA